VNKIHGVQKDYCSHFLAGGERRRLSSAVAAVAIFVFMRKKLKRVCPSVDQRLVDWISVRQMVGYKKSHGRSAATVNYG
ncbi:unnamed protein product, partial [Brassica oleracea var. botrytis]